MLRHGMTIQFGRNHVYKFMDPRFEEVSSIFLNCPFLHVLVPCSPQKRKKKRRGGWDFDPHFLASLFPRGLQFGS